MPAGPSLLLLLSGGLSGDDEDAIMPGPLWTGLFATDEQIYERSDDDFRFLAPSQSRLCAGENGIVPSGSWILNSPTVDFQAKGIQSGHVVLLENYGWPENTPGRIDALGVEAATGHNLTTRRIGDDAGVADPPLPTRNGQPIKFAVYSFRNRIRNVTRLVSERFLASGYTSAQVEAAGLSETREEMTVDWVLADCYLAKMKEGDPRLGGSASAGNSEYAGKSKAYREKAEGLFALISSLVGIVGTDSASRRARAPSSGSLGGRPVPYPPGGYSGIGSVPVPGVDSPWGDTSSWPGY